MRIRPNFELVSEGDDILEKEYGNISPFNGFQIIFMNLPYLKEKFLLIANNLLDKLQDGGRMISINPARWFTDPLANVKKKRNRAIDEARQNLYRHCDNAYLIQREAANKLFGIGAFTDLGYFCFTKDTTGCTKTIHTDKRYLEIVDKTLKQCKQHRTLQTMVNASKRTQSPYYVFLNNMYGEAKGFNYISSKPTNNVVYFDTVNEVHNFKKYCSSLSIRTLHYMLSQNQHAEMGFIPVPDDLTHEWSDAEIADWLHLNRRQAKYLHRHIQDYRFKDYLTYTVESDLNGKIRYNGVETPETKQLKLSKSGPTPMAQPERVQEKPRSMAYINLLNQQKAVEVEIETSIKQMKCGVQEMAILNKLLKVTRTRHHRQLNALVAREAKQRKCRESKPLAESAPKKVVLHDIVVPQVGIQTKDNSIFKHRSRRNILYHHATTLIYACAPVHSYYTSADISVLVTECRKAPQRRTARRYRYRNRGSPLKPITTSR